MPTDVIMPALGMNQETGRLIAWMRREGEQVTKGETLMEIETDKATVEIDAPATGVLANVTAHAGDEIPVGQPIAIILAPGEMLVAMPTRVRPVAVLTSTQLDPGAPAQSRSPNPGASPKARRLAARRDLDFGTVAGTGPGGAVKAVDVATALRGLGRATPDVWAAMARHTTESWQQAPHFYLDREVNARDLKSWQAAARKQDSDVTVTDLLIRLAAAVLPSHPRVSGGAGVHIGLAIAVRDGVVVPVIRDADRLSLAEISAARRVLVGRARDERLRHEDLQGGTFTISNLGMYGVDAFSAIVNVPQAAILATGRIADRVIAVGGRPAVCPTLRMTLACDHRLVDGARGAAFLADLGNLVEEPARLF